MPDPRRAPGAQLATGRVSRDTPLAVTPHTLATRAALDVMERGGNAVDGAIAANAVLGVVLQDTCGIGGDLFALVHVPGSSRPLALNASGRAGSGVDATELRGMGLTEITVESPHSITVPGCIDGWHAMRDRLGELPLEDSLQPAIRHARDGFVVSEELASTLVGLQSQLEGEPSAAPFYPQGRPAPAGMTIRRPELAATMEQAAQSRDLFYLGEVGIGIEEASAGAVTVTDRKIRQAEWVDPIHVDIYGHTAWTVPPNSQGYVTLAASWITERLAPPAEPDDPAFYHAMVEACRAIEWELDETVSDPSTAPGDPRGLLSPKRLAARADRIDIRNAARWKAPEPAPGGTAHLCVRDGRGMGVSLTQSNFHGIGSRRSAGATGVFLHDRGAGFNLLPGHPNEYAPGRRPQHTLSPTLWTKEGRLSLLLGTRGGYYQPQILMQVAAHLLYRGVSPDEAQDAPRFQIVRQDANGSVLRLESRTASSVIDGLRERGHSVSLAESWETGWGPVGLVREEDTHVEAAADRRVSTASASAG